MSWRIRTSGQSGRGTGSGARYWRWAWLALPLLLVAGCTFETRSLTDADGDGIRLDVDCDDSDPSIGARYADMDGDAHGDPGVLLAGCTSEGGGDAGVAIGDDCDDTDPRIYPGASYYPDHDGDSYGDPLYPLTTGACPLPLGYTTDQRDCDDGESSIHPEALEIECNGIDEDCDGLDDDHPDSDGDGYDVCPPDVNGADSNPSDCNDDEALVNPAASEIECNALDEDCNGDADDHPDADQDGVDACSDCDDAEATTYPGALEVCDDNADNNCNGHVDELQAFYLDSDRDGYGDNAIFLNACARPVGYVTDNTDCNDMDASIHPGAAEIVCNVVDENCDGPDDDHPDSDHDGFDACKPDVPGADDLSADCEETDPLINPAALEIVCNRIDENCSGSSDDHPDADHDGFDACEADVNGSDGLSADCDDSSAHAYPQAPEQCNGQDDDCDDEIDEGLEPRLYFPDVDRDGFGTEPGLTLACADALEEGYAGARGDCDDVVSSTYPGAEDLSGDGIDADCGGYDGPDPHVGLSSSSQSSIEDALDAAVAGNAIWVGPGIYAEHDLTFGGKALNLASTQLADRTLIDARQMGRVFIFSKEGPDAVLDGFTITGGNGIGNEGGGIGSEAIGGGIYLYTASLHLNNLIVTKNTASYSGGGISMAYSKPTLTNCIITSNTTTKASGSDYTFGGGGITLNESRPTLVGCRLSGNSTPGFGGALKVTNGSAPVLTDCTLADNTAYNRGGALASFPGTTTTLTGCTISGNATQSGTGGGLYIEGNFTSGSTILQASGCVLQKNHADGPGARGGGASIYAGAEAMFKDSEDGSRQCIISTNSASLVGAGLDIESSSATLSSCEISGNGTGAMPNSGGGIWIEGSSNLSSVPTSVNLADCEITSNAAAGSGGNIGVSGAKLTSSGSTFSFGRASTGAGIYVSHNDASNTSNEITFDNVAITDNVASSNGGGLWSDRGLITIANESVFERNSAAKGGGMFLIGMAPTVSDTHFTGNGWSADGRTIVALQGGAVWIEDAEEAGGKASFSDCTCSGNAAFNGGGLFMDRSSLTFESSTFENNISDGGGIANTGIGGGAYIANSTGAVFRDVAFEGNTALSAGGGFFILTAPSVTFFNCTIFGNKSTGGGGLFSADSNAQLTNCRIEENKALSSMNGFSGSGNGGGIAFNLNSETSPGEIDIENCLLLNNSAEFGGGGILGGATNGTLKILNSTIVGNYAPNYSGGISLIEGSLSIRNTVLAYNSNNSNTPQVDANLVCGKPGFCDISLQNSDVYFVGGGGVDPAIIGSNLTDEPEFLQYSSSTALPSNYHLAAGSPLINTGDSSLTDPDGSPSDIGAYGGQNADGWDLDGDGFPDYFWPGLFSSAPSGFSASSYDCNDLESAVHPGAEGTGNDCGIP